MSDWGFYGFENIAWDEFGTSDDHIVPHQSVEHVSECVAPCDAHKKLRHVEDVGKSVNSRGSATKTALQKTEDTYLCTPMKEENCTILEGSQSHASENLVPASCSPRFITSESALASHGARISDECFDSCDVDADSNILFSKNHIPGSRVSLDDSRSSCLSLDEVLPAPINIDYSESENKDKENDLVYYDLPDIDNFEDIDRILRNCHSTYEEGLAGTTDDLSWLSSSSNTIYGSEVTFESGLQSSCSKLSPLNSTSGHHLVDTIFLSRSDHPTANHDKPSSLCYQPYADWLDTSTDNMGEAAHNKQVNDLGSVLKPSATAQIYVKNALNGPKNPDMINVHLKKMESQYSPEENKMQQYADHKLLPSAVPTQACSSQHILKQKHLLEPASSLHISNSHEQMEYMHPAPQVPFPQTPGVKFECESDPSSSYNIFGNVMNHAPQCSESFSDQIYKSPIATKEKLKKLPKHQLGATVIPENLHKQASFTSKASTQKRHGYCHEIGADSRVHNISLEPTVEVDSSLTQEGLFISSVYPDDISVEATSFRQLQDVMEQLDIRTKLCIRDSLYRLAWSAQHRHDFTDTSDCSRVSKDARRLHCSAPNECSDLMDDAENVTNPIDRSIAYLLFTGLPEPAMGYV